jgi:hypothetical protein
MAAPLLDTLRLVESEFNFSNMVRQSFCDT